MQFVLTDGAGGTSATVTKLVSVANVVPTSLTVTTSAANINEGQSITLMGSFNNIDPVDVPTVTISWGDGTLPQVFTLPVGATSFSFTHLYGVSVSPISPSPTKYIITMLHVGLNVPVIPIDTVTIADVVPVVSAEPAASFIAANTTFTGSGSFVDPGNATWTVTADYGDGQGPQPVAYDAQHDFTLSHNYASEGAYTVVVSVNDNQGGVGTTSFVVQVFTAPPVAPTAVTAAPGTTVTGTSGNVTVALTRSSTAATAGSLVVAQLPTAAPVSSGTLVVSTSSGGTTPGLATVAKFDVRAVNLSDQDSAVVTFTVFSPNGNPPQLDFTDPTTGALIAVQGSTAVPNSLTVTRIPGDPLNFLVRVVFDSTSTPALVELTGTVFTLSVPTAPQNNSSIAQGEALLASLATTSAVAQPQFEVSFGRGGLTSGSETTAATVASQATAIMPGIGEYLNANTAFIRDMLFDSYRAFGDSTDTGAGGAEPSTIPDGGGDGDPGINDIDGAFETELADLPLATPVLFDTFMPVKAWYAFAHDDSSWFGF